MSAAVLSFKKSVVKQRLFVFLLICFSLAYFFSSIPSVFAYSNSYSSYATPTTSPDNYGSYTSTSYTKSGADPLMLQATDMIIKDHKSTFAAFAMWTSSAVLSQKQQLNFYRFLIRVPLFTIPFPIPILLVLMFIGPFGLLIILGFCFVLLYKITRHFLIPIVLPIVITVISFLFGKLWPLLKTGVSEVSNKISVGRLGETVSAMAVSQGKSQTKGKPKAPKYSFLEITFPSDTTKSSFATEQLYKLLHALSRQGTFMQGLLKHKKTYSLEIVASRDEGIRFFIVVPEKEADIIHRNLLSFLPGLKVKETPDYLDSTKKLQQVFNGEDKENGNDKPAVGVAELTLTKHFALPLQNQKILEEHDSISFLTGNMTKLQPGELISFQLVATPVISDIHRSEVNKMEALQDHIYKGLPLTPVLKGGIGITPPPFLLAILSPLAYVAVFGLKFLISIPSLLFDSTGKSVPIFQSTPKADLQQILNPYERELAVVVKEKLSQNLFETSLRLLIVADSKKEVNSRASGLIASFGQFESQYQSFTTRGMFPKALHIGKRLSQFKERGIAGGAFHQNPILSTSEISDLYHFPYTDITKVEGLVKNKSSNLPAPRSFKRSDTDLDVIVGKNTYGGEETPIGQTLPQRQRHTYIIGKTGMGKTEMLKNLIYQDMESGKGFAVLDPHGDLFYELLRIVPKNRRKDVVVFNPADKEYPVGLNILSSGIRFTDSEEGQDWITSSIVAIFQKISDPKFWGPRLEHILRNASMTALNTSSPSLFIIQRLLTDTKGYQKRVSGTLSDPILKQFWDSEFSLFGKMQQGDAVSPITNRVGKFITSKKSRNILLQKDSTFNIQKIMDEGKILLVNLSKGEIGEDHSHFFGSLIISLIQLAAYQRIHVPENQRRDFFLYVDEFQNFATHIFEDISSEGRKFHTPLITSHQNIAQIKDPNLLQIVAGNADSFIAMKAGPDDERFILPFMEPEVEKGSIVNLPPYKFFMKVTNDDSEDAFSGETQLLNIKGSDEVAKEVTDYSRKHYATPRKEVEAYLANLFTAMESGSKTKGTGEKPEEPQPEEPGKDNNKTNKSSWKKRVAKRKERYV